MLEKELDFSPGEFTAPTLSTLQSTQTNHIQIKFTGSGTRQRAPNSFSFQGKGDIDIAPEHVTICGRRRRMFRYGATEKYQFRTADICNVRATGAYVQFEARLAGQAGLQNVGFIAEDHASAIAIIHLLPRHQTESFAVEHAELGDFQTRLDTLSPRAPVTTAIVAINVIVFLLMVLNGAGFMTPNAEVAISWGSNFGPMTVDGQWWRLLTSTFIHFGVLHLVFNMVALYPTGRLVERMYGSLPFLLLYLFSGLIGSIVSLLWHPSINSAGASGAIFGVFGGLLVFMINPKNAVPRSIMNAHRNSTIFFIGFNLFNGFAHSGIDNGAHIGGLLGGIAIGFLLARPLSLAARAQLVTMRLITACIAGVAALAILSYPLAHPDPNVLQERHFNAALRALGPHEIRVIAEFNELRKKAQEHAITNTDAADELDRNIVPQWQTLRDTIAAPQLTDDSKFYSLQQALIRYLDDRMTVCKLIAQSTHTNDPSLMAQAAQADKDAEREIGVIRQLQVN